MYIIKSFNRSYNNWLILFKEYSKIYQSGYYKQILVNLIKCILWQKIENINFANN